LAYGRKGEGLKIAEALAERSDCQRRIEDLKKRLTRVARVQEGEQPAEDPSALLADVNRTFDRLSVLIMSINRTNAATIFREGQTIADAIAEREMAGKKRDFLASIAEAASTRQDRYSKSEVRFVATVPVTNLQKQIDQLSKEFRELDTKLQELNWKTEIV
jgi:vacuolar-type H+-ATPase subunit I/STV1